MCRVCWSVGLRVRTIRGPGVSRWRPARRVVRRRRLPVGQWAGGGAIAEVDFTTYYHVHRNAQWVVVSDVADCVICDVQRGHVCSPPNGDCGSCEGCEEIRTSMGCHVCHRMMWDGDSVNQFYCVICDYNSRFVIN